MKQINLTQGKTATISTKDYGQLSAHKWHAWNDGKRWYARRNKKINGKVITHYMHHAVVGKPANGKVTDHKDGNGLNNRRSNLRNVTQKTNLTNQYKRDKDGNPIARKGRG